MATPPSVSQIWKVLASFTPQVVAAAVAWSLCIRSEVLEKASDLPSFLFWVTLGNSFAFLFWFCPEALPSEFVEGPDDLGRKKDKTRQNKTEQNEMEKTPLMVEDPENEAWRRWQSERPGATAKKMSQPGPGRS